MSKSSDQLAPLTSEQQTALEAMSAPVRNVFDRIRATLSNMVRTDIMARHAVGMMVHEVKSNERKYGQNVIGQYAKALGGAYTEVELYQYRALAVTYTKEQLEKLLLRPLPSGGQIAWSHLRLIVRLAGEERKELREEVTEQFFSEKMTAAELARLVQMKLGKEVTERKPLMPTSPTAAMQQLDGYRVAIVSRMSGWKEAIFNKLAETPPDQCDEKLLERLQELRKGQLDLRDTADTLAQDTEKAIQRIERILSAREGKTPPRPEEPKVRIDAPKAAAGGKSMTTAVRRSSASVIDMAMAKARELRRPAVGDDYDDEE